MLEGYLQFSTLPEIPPGENTWRVAIDGVEVPSPRHLVMWLEVPGRPQISLTLGFIVDGKHGYDGLSHCEWGGGATIVVPFVIYEGQLYVALVEQYRYLVGGMVSSVPRGYTDRGRPANEQADEELAGEIGRRSPRWKMFELEGEPASAMTSFGYTRPDDPRLQLPDGRRPGARFFAREIDPDDVEMTEAGLIFKDGVFAPEDEEEAIARASLVPWSYAVQGHDACPATAVARLMAHFEHEGRMSRPIFR